MTAPTVFSPRMMLAWLTAVVAAFALSIYFMAFPPPEAERPVIGPSASSRSAIGFAGFAELITRAGIRVVKRGGGDKGNAAGQLVILANPQDARDEDGRANRMLIILPKWFGYRDARHSGWITDAQMVPLGIDDRVLSKAGVDGRTARVPRPGTWTANALGIAPELPAEVQVIGNTKLRPVIGDAGHVLVGEHIDGNRRIWIVADPELLANHGLFSGRNPELAIKLVNTLAPPKGEVLFNEQVLGRAVSPSGNPLTLMLQFPYIIITFQLIAAAAFLLWAAMPRFGMPMPAPEVLSAGKRRLIDNAANLLRFSGRPEVIVANYVRLSVRSAARELRSPPGLEWRQLVAWLTRVGASRGVAADFADLVRRAEALATSHGASARALVEIVTETHRWKREILNGP